MVDDEEQVIDTSNVNHKVGWCRLTLSKAKLKPPGTKRLKPNCDILLSTSAFKFNLRHCNKSESQTPTALKAE